jgi:hypothetical protein
MSKWQICYTEKTDLLLFTVNVWKSHQPQCSLQLVCEDCMLFFWVCLHVSLWGRGIENVSRQFISCIHLFFIDLDLHPTSQTKQKKCNWVRSGVLTWFKQLCHGNLSELDLCSYELFSYYEQYCHLLKYWYFLLNHPVFSVTLKC